MIDPVIDRNIRDIKRIHALKAADVVPVLLGAGSPLVMGMNAADGAEIVPGCVRVELVDAELLGTLDDVQPAQRYGSHDDAATPTIRAVAPPRVHDAVRQAEQQLDGAAVAGGAVLSLDGRVTYALQAHLTPTRACLRQRDDMNGWM